MKNVDGTQVEFDLADESDDITEKRLRAERYCREQFARGGQLTVRAVADYCKVNHGLAYYALENTGQVVGNLPGSQKEKIYGPKVKDSQEK